MTVAQVLAAIQLAESLLTAVLNEVSQSKATWSASDLATVTANLQTSEDRLAAVRAQADADAA